MYSYAWVEKVVVDTLRYSFFTMSLIGIAIIGKRNEPLYLCDCTKLPNDDNSIENDPAIATKAVAEQQTTNTEDPFGFLQPSSTAQGKSLEMEQQFILHAALDRLEEQVGASKPDGTMPLRKAVRSGVGGGTATSTSTPTPATTPNKKSTRQPLGPPAGQWLGLLTVPDEASAVYGYVTATNVKFLVLLQQQSNAGATSTSSSQMKKILQQQTKAVHKLCTMLHGHYITYLMNPFSKIDNLVSSASLDRNIRRAVLDFDDSQKASN